MRDRLIEMIKYAHGICREDNCELCQLKKEYGTCRMIAIADYLLANGVVVQKQSEWQVHQNNEYWHYDCPFCDDGYATKGQDKTPPNYCGNCGAKLKECEG